jgi:hypothetical protein
VQTLTGSCHCGAVVFEVDIDDGLGRLSRCNCSLCRRRGAIMAAVPLDRLRVLKGADNLTLYQWNTGIAKHYFCRTCGIYTHHQRRSNPNEYAVNIACLEGVDPFNAGEVALGNGAAMSVEAAKRR